jgi:hypothetical protein
MVNGYLVKLVVCHSLSSPPGQGPYLYPYLFHSELLRFKALKGRLAIAQGINPMT